MSSFFCAASAPLSFSINTKLAFRDDSTKTIRVGRETRFQKEKKTSNAHKVCAI